MKEIDDIIKAYKQAQNAGMRAALATVVKVEGSSYRRPGARMLVTEDGRLTGAISGGCLEGDARRKALFAIEQCKNKLVTYDSMDEDNEIFSIQLGCNGIVHILFEPIEHETQHPLQLLEQVSACPEDACLITLFQEGQSEQIHSGTCLLFQAGKITSGVRVEEGLLQTLSRDAQAALQQKASDIKSYYIPDGVYSGLLDYISSPVTLVIAGAGNDAMPLAQLANNLGWKVSVIDGRPAYATLARFPMAQNVQIIKQGEKPPQAQLYMLMSHNYPYDLAMLRALMDTDCAYIGILGPRKKRERLIADLEAEGLTIGGKSKQVYGPAGFDIGAETAEEIALSVIAEMKAVLAKANAISLRDKEDFIHPRASV
jgi:xanthine/CO dehydrogenase XdhC/CoxF family maturation factor